MVPNLTHFSKSFFAFLNDLKTARILAKTNKTAPPKIGRRDLMAVAGN